MARIADLFYVRKGKGAYLSQLAPGHTPLVSSSTANHGIVGLVEIEPTFRAPAITVGRVAGMAFVQTEDFATVPDDMAVLAPKGFMPPSHLYIVAALINRTRWRFSYYRKLTPTRLGKLEIPFEHVADKGAPFIQEPRSLLPRRVTDARLGSPALDFRRIPLTAMFDVKRGNIHNASLFGPGETPLVSCSTRNNGILAYLDVTDAPIYEHAVTVAYNGSPLTAKYHPYQFAAKDDVAVLLPKPGLTLEAVLLVATWCSSQTWRYSYYRKCYHTKLTRLEVPMPINAAGSIDTEGIEHIVRAGSPYWDYVRAFWEAPNDTSG